MILDSEQSRRSTADPFWKEAEKPALTAILLQLNQLHARPAPHMIQELISTLSLQQLNEQMMKSSDPKVPLYWGNVQQGRAEASSRCADWLGRSVRRFLHAEYDGDLFADHESDGRAWSQIR